MEVLKVACDSWSEQVLHSLSIMQKSGCLCDVKINLSDDTMILSHGCVLSAASPFFKSILEGREAPELDFRDFPSRIIQQVIQFIYTGNVAVINTEVYVLYSVATQLNIPALVALLHHLVITDEGESQHLLSAEDNSKNSTNLLIKNTDKIVERTVKPDAEDSCLVDGTVNVNSGEHTVKEMVSEGHQTDNQLNQEGDSVSGEGPSSVVADEVTNKAEVTILENILHTKGLHTNKPVDISNKSGVGVSLENSQTGADEQSNEAVDNADYHCNECNVGYTSSLHYHKHMHRKHGKALPIDIYILMEKERKDRLGLNVSFVNDAEKEEKYIPHIRRSKRRERRKRCLRDAGGFDDKNSDWSSAVSESHGKMLSRKNGFVCLACRRSFKTISSLKLHETIHREERPFKCKLCGRAFNQVGNLRVHERSHRGEKPFQCSQCGRGFGQSGHLKTHMRTHTGEKPFMCSVCGGAFGSKTNLDSHMRCHTGEKPYKCITCGKAFSQLGNLNAHRRSHTGVKPYRCCHCSKAFTALCNYQRHLKRHLLDRPFHCPDCGKGYVNKSEMRSHQRNKHMIVFDPDHHQRHGVHYPGKIGQNVINLT